ncbi:ABC transporter ATP-binding protein [Streptococcus ferus]|uniref:ABC transporter ATP-binding protein n=1 Tax=Streptococcus ferus TaxID=1345 RepID=UPI0023577C3B|nr:ABC transporter ATP-binding protein [Streptococcus ferus]
MFIQVKDLRKSYGQGGSYVEVLKGITLSLNKGEMCVIQGSSGSGKSTLLNCIGGLDLADSGSILVDDLEIVGLSLADLSNYRRRYLGFIFQMYNLIMNLTVRENIEVCRYLSDNPLDVDELLQILGLTEHQHKFPSQLSGGQQQRCAIARALVKNPKLLLCDEPTGALNSELSKEILILLEKINRQYGTTIVIVTHNNAIRNMVDRVVEIKDGIISENFENVNKITAKDLENL